MNYENFKTGFNKPSVFTAQQYGTKTTVEVDRSDLTLDEVMDAFQTLIIGMGYHESSFKNWVLERASEYQEEEDDKWDLNDEFADVRHQYESREELENDFFGDYNATLEQDEDRYAATQEDEDEFSNDGGFDGRPHFEWGDEPEDDDNLFEGEEWEANENLKAANERYKKALKTLSAKQKKNTKK